MLNTVTEPRKYRGVFFARTKANSLTKLLAID